MMQNDFIITPADESRLSGILEIERASFSMPWNLDGFKAELSSPDSYFTSAVLNGTVVGFCVLHRFDSEAEIFNIAVSELHRGNHIGHSLLRDALDYADQNGITKIFLEVRKSNAPAIGLYSQNGFKILGTRKNYYNKPTEDAIIMQRLHI